MARQLKDTDGYGSTTSKRNKVAVGDDAQFKGYINYPLSAEQKEAFEVWFASGSYHEAMEYFTACGVNLSIKRERTKDDFIASGTQRDPSSVNAGLCVTARARTAGVAFGRLLFIMTLLNHGDSWETVAPMADPDRW